jgi:hypothetical protein
MTKVYVVTKGSYSDFHVDQIFSSKEKAENYIKLVNNKYNVYSHVNSDIEEYELDPDTTLPKSLHKFKTFYHVEMDRDGNTISCHHEGYDVFKPEDSQEHYRLWLRKDYNEETGKFEYPYTLNGYDVNANDEKHAIKKMGEKRQYLLRIGKWPEQWNPNMASSIEVE